MITTLLFFASSALYPIAVMPAWLRAQPHQPAHLRGKCAPWLPIGTPADLPLDFGVLLVAVIAGVVTASSLIGRLAR